MKRSFLSFVLFAAGFLLASTFTHAQSVTSSGMGGVVLDPGGDALADVTVTAVHEPSGSRFRARTNNSGRYTMRGLRIGGPYTVTFRGPDGSETIRRGINLNLQQKRTLNVTLQTAGDVFELEAFEVVSNELSSVFNENKQGSSSVIGSGDISMLPTVSRSLNDIVRLDPRMASYDRDSGTVSAGGKNTRYNSLLIDGVPTNDSFGLSKSGLPALKQPFSLESIAEISIQISPYSVENAGFTGAAISAVTKSGTNEFSGSVFGFYRNEQMVGDLYDVYIEEPEPGEEPESENVPFQDFLEYTAGFTLGGPIIKDKLFFFALYETVEETITRDPGDFYPVQEELDRILFMIDEVYQFDPGSLEDPGDQNRKDDKYLVKLDYNISDRHRMTARYQLTEGSDPRYPGYAGDAQIAFSSHFYTEQFELSDYNVELFSNWSSTFQTEFLAAFKRFKKYRETPQPPLPAIEIDSVDGVEGDPGSISLGTHVRSQLNDLQVDTTVLRFKATQLLGDHQIKVGFQYENFDNYNAFIEGVYGSWFFRNGTPSFENAVNPGALETYSLTLPAEGQSGIADWSMAIASAYVEDNWLVNDKLTLTAGLRIDYPLMDDMPPQARSSVEDDDRTFEDVFGSSNQVNVDGNYVIQPRLGFNYALDDERRVQLRGGAGLFFGTAPHVWISSIFVNNGRSQEFYRASTSRTPAFSPDALNPPIPDQVNARVNVDFLDEDFKMPTEWKSNLALDLNLFADIAWTNEVSLSWTENDIHYIHENLQQESGFLSTGFLPDGRIVYDNQESRLREAGYRNVIRLTNTDKGYSRQFTTLFQRPVQNGWGFRAGYTYTRSKNVNDGQSATAYSNWVNNVGFNLNSEVLGRSRYETTHRFIASGTYEHRWNKRQKTSVTLVYEGRTGRPFSFVYGRGTFSTDMNRDGTGAANDLVYVPTGVDDPLVRWGDASNSGRDTQGVAFMEFVERTDGLSEYKGEVVPRNTGTSPWVHQFDLNITHEIVTWKEQTLEVIFAIENLGNLINDEWGKEKRPRGPDGNVPMLTASREVEIVGGELNTYYIYDPAIEELNGEDWYETRNFSSRWAMQIGLRYTF